MKLAPSPARNPAGPADAQCYRAWRVDTNGHTYQLFDSRGCPSRIDVAGRYLQTDPGTPK
jgi:hypothetical protein